MTPTTQRVKKKSVGMAQPMDGMNMRTPLSHEDKKRPIFSSEEERKVKRRRKVNATAAEEDESISAVYQQIVQES